ncbi:MAG: hypothetical protein AAGC47_03040 [Bacteroidota bacterium]
MKLNEGEEVTLDDISEIRRYITETNKGQRRPVLIELGYGSTIADGVYEYMALNENRFSIADALLISTFAHKISAMFYLRYFKPQSPTRVFHDIFDALKWMEKQG